MKRIFAAAFSLAALLLLTACAKGEPISEALPASTAEPTAVPTAEPAPEPMPEPTAEPAEHAAEPTVEPVQETYVSPYAWLGYAELPQNHYYDILATGCFCREYDFYALGHVVHQKQASDITNQFSFDGMNTVSLILNGMTYVLNTKNKTYAERDAASAWQNTLAMQAENRAKGINLTGKKYVTAGSEPVPLLCENGDAESYNYYEFLTDLSSSGTVYTMRERIYFKDGDVYAIHTLITSGEHLTESAEVITLVSGTPDPSLFALPEDFNAYAPIG